MPIFGSGESAHRVLRHDRDSPEAELVHIALLRRSLARRRRARPFPSTYRMRPSSRIRLLPSVVFPAARLAGDAHDHSPSATWKLTPSSARTSPFRGAVVHAQVLDREAHISRSFGLRPRRGRLHYVETADDGHDPEARDDDHHHIPSWRRCSRSRCSSSVRATSRSRGRARESRGQRGQDRASEDEENVRRGRSSCRRDLLDEIREVRAPEGAPADEVARGEREGLSPDRPGRHGPDVSPISTASETRH